MSTDCENLLKKFLILNPSKRGTLEVSSLRPSGQVLGPKETSRLSSPSLPFSFPLLPSKS